MCFSSLLLLPGFFQGVYKDITRENGFDFFPQYATNALSRLRHIAWNKAELLTVRTEISVDIVHTDSDKMLFC
jgi:hypothetical protein